MSIVIRARQDRTRIGSSRLYYLSFVYFSTRIQDIGNRHYRRTKHQVGDKQSKYVIHLIQRAAVKDYPVENLSKDAQVITQRVCDFLTQCIQHQRGGKCDHRRFSLHLGSPKSCRTKDMYQTIRLPGQVHYDMGRMHPQPPPSIPASRTRSLPPGPVPYPLPPRVVIERRVLAISEELVKRHPLVLP